MARKNERRRRKRIDIALPISIKYNKEKILTTTRNISVLGTYIEIGRKIPIGATLSIGIKIPRTKPAKSAKHRQINCVGIAFRCQTTGLPEPKNQYGIGIFFRSFSAAGEKELSKYINFILLREKKLGKIFMRKRRRKLLKQKGGKR